MAKPGKYCIEDGKVINVESTKDVTKTPYHMVDFNFIAGMARNMASGIDQDADRNEGDWMRIEWTEETANHYRDAIVRHLVEGFDPYAIACNAMIIAWHEREK